MKWPAIFETNYYMESIKQMIFISVIKFKQKNKLG